jgi:multiple sugar transport system permease protein
MSQSEETRQINRQDKGQDTKGRTLISDSELKNPAISLFYRILFLLLIVGTMTSIIPFLWLFIGGLKSPDELSSLKMTIFPAGSPLAWGWSNYLVAFEKFKMVRYFTNTLILMLGIWFFQVTTSSLAGYSMAKLRVPFSKFFLIIFLATLMVPFETIMIPLYLTVKDPPLVKGFIRLLFSPEQIEAVAGLQKFMQRGLLDSYWGIILPSSVSAFNIFLFLGFFKAIPDDLIEAARIDGCSELGIFFRVIIPLSMPIFAVVTIFSGLASWNSFTWPYLVLSNQEKFPIMVRLYYLFENPETTRNIMLATLFLSSIPPIVLFFVFQKQIVRGITLTGLKG